MKKIQLITGLLTLILFGIYGCTSANYDQRQTVEKYNKAVVELYKTGNSTNLEQLATETEQRKISEKFANMKAEGKSMEAVLNKITFIESAENSKYLATVKTKEEWSYRIFDQGQEAGGKFEEVTYSVTYNLIKNKKKRNKTSGNINKNWLVNAVTITEEQKK